MTHALYFLSVSISILGIDYIIHFKIHFPSWIRSQSVKIQSKVSHLLYFDSTVKD